MKRVLPGTSHIYGVGDIADALLEQVTKTDRPVEALPGRGAATLPKGPDSRR